MTCHRLVSSLSAFFLLQIARRRTLGSVVLLPSTTDDLEMASKTSVPRVLKDLSRALSIPRLS